MEERTRFHTPTAIRILICGRAVIRISCHGYGKPSVENFQPIAVPLFTAPLPWYIPTVALYWHWRMEPHM